jgi:drug/metabolite transporter (DMT)-like permease
MVSLWLNFTPLVVTILGSFLGEEISFKMAIRMIIASLGSALVQFKFRKH